MAYFKGWPRRPDSLPRLAVTVAGVIFLLGAAAPSQAVAQATQLPPGIYKDTHITGKDRGKSSPEGQSVPGGGIQAWVFSNCSVDETITHNPPLPPQSPPVAHFIANWPCYCSGKDPSSSFRSMAATFRNYGIGQAFPNSATRQNIREMADAVMSGITNNEKTDKFLRNLGLYSPFYFTVDPKVGERKAETYYCVNGVALQTWANQLKVDAQRILNR